MNLLEKIDNLIEAVQPFEVVSDDKTFEKMANFILELDPEILTEKELNIIMDIIGDLESEAEALEEEVKAKKTAITKKQYAGKWYRNNKEKVKRKKKELERSIEGKKRERMKPIMAKSQKTPTGRPQREYNI